MPTNVIQTNQGATQILLDALGVTPSLILRLFDNSLASFTDSTQLSDLTECTFTGYTPATPSWTTPTEVGGVAYTDGSTVTFTYTGGSSTIIYGFYLTDTTGVYFYGGNLFASPITLDTFTTSLQMTVRYTQESKY